MKGPAAAFALQEDGISCSGDKSKDCVASADSHRFEDTFENVYTAASLQVPWWFNAGNVRMICPQELAPPPC